MCITSNEAKLTGTILAPVFDLKEKTHYLMYQNTFQNESGKKNAMILPILGDFLEAFDSTGVDLTEIAESIKPASLQTRASASMKVVKVGNYMIATIKNGSSSEIKAELQKIQPEYQISDELLEWFVGRYQHGTLCFCFFEGSETVKSEPIIIRYKPYQWHNFLVPMIDSHDGGVPKNDLVQRDHELIIGYIGYYDDETKHHRYATAPPHNFLRVVEWMYGAKYVSLTDNFDMRLNIPNIEIPTKIFASQDKVS